MSKKINPISFRLGLLQTWNTTLTVYNNYPHFYHLSKKQILEIFLIRFFESNNLFLSSVNWVFNSKIMLTITYSIFQKNLFMNPQMLKTKLTNILKLSFSLPVKIYLINKPSWFDSSALLTSYIKYSILKGNSFKQTFQNINKILYTKLNTKKVVCTINGSTTLKLKGFKIKSFGRFDNSRNQMTNSLQYKKGTSSVLKLNNYIEYSQTFIYTKSGTCSFHVWLIYSF